MLYKCPVCCKQFTKKFNFERHMQRKISCKPKILITEDNKTTISMLTTVSQKEADCKPTVSQKEAECKPVDIQYKINCDTVTNKYVCLICKKNFKFRQSLYNHKKKHLNYEEEVKKMNTTEKNTEDIILLKQKIETMEMNQNILTAKKKSSKNKTINNVIINGSINNGIVNNEIINGPINNEFVNNIKIVNFGNEDIDRYTYPEIRDLLFREEKPVLKLIEMKHFNKKIPEQQNIQLTNLRSQYIDVYDNDRWMKKFVTETLKKLFDNTAIELNEMTEIVQPNYKNKISKPINRTIEIFNAQHIIIMHKNILMDERDEIINEARLLIYNKTKEFNDNKTKNIQNNEKEIIQANNNNEIINNENNKIQTNDNNEIQVNNNENIQANEREIIQNNDNNEIQNNEKKNT